MHAFQKLRGKKIENRCGFVGTFFFFLRLLGGAHISAVVLQDSEKFAGSKQFWQTSGKIPRKLRANSGKPMCKLDLPEPRRANAPPHVSALLWSEFLSGQLLFSSLVPLSIGWASCTFSWNMQCAKRHSLLETCKIIFESFKYPPANFPANPPARYI